MPPPSAFSANYALRWLRLQPGKVEPAFHQIPLFFPELVEGLWQRYLVGNPLFLYRVLKQQPAPSLPVLSAVEGSRSLGLLRLDGS